MYYTKLTGRLFDTSYINVGGRRDLLRETTPKIQHMVLNNVDFKIPQLKFHINKSVNHSKREIRVYVCSLYKEITKILQVRSSIMIN